MLPKWHIILGFIFSLLVWAVFPQIKLGGFIIIFLSSFLVDIDHYLLYCLNKKNFSIKSAYIYYRNLPKKHKPIMHFFHTIEFAVAIALLGLYLKVFFMIFIGFIFHSFLDIAEMAKENNINNREFSFLRYIIYRKTEKYFRFN